MRKAKKIAILIIATLSIIISLTISIQASNSISGIATCYVPQIITLSDGSKVAATEQIQPEVVLNQPEQNTSLNADTSDTIKQREENISEEKQELEVINTVCAK